jgi:hypothetical protein
MGAFSTIAFVLIVIGAMVILIFRDWRINAVALAMQYLAAFVLVTISWPIGLAVVKLIAGWMATAAIALTCMRQKNSESPSEPTASLFFRALAGLLTVMLLFIMAPTLQAQVFPGVELVIIQGGVMLIGMALMQLGTNSEPYLIIISLLSFLTGFEVIHAALELSTLLAGLLVVVNLGLALVGVYFIVNAGEADQSPEMKESR